MALPHILPIEPNSDEWRLLLTAVAAEGGRQLAAFAARSKRLFAIVSPWAPGVWFVGGEAASGDAAGTVFSLSGTGISLEAATVSCLGEGIERLSQVERAGDIAATAPMHVARPNVPEQTATLVNQMISTGSTNGAPNPAIDWLVGRDLASGNAIWSPADWCLRRSVFGPLRMPDTPLSTGAAAGPTSEAAAIRAMLELVERDAVALWWCGGRRGRPLALENGAVGNIAQLIAQVRQGEVGRTSWLLDITTDLDIPVVVAISVASDGRGLACGMASRLSLEEAVCAAIFEMCQMELAMLVVELKRQQRGDAALNTIDRRHLTRASRIDANHCDLLFPFGMPRIARESDATSDATALLALKQKFAAHAIQVALLDLTRPDIVVPVVVAIAPELQRLPSALQTERLRRCIGATGGTVRATGGIELM